MREKDICMKTGQLILAKGYEVTYTMMERLRSYARRVSIAEPLRVLVPQQRS